MDNSSNLMLNHLIRQTKTKNLINNKNQICQKKGSSQLKKRRREKEIHNLKANKKRATANLHKK